MRKLLLSAVVLSGFASLAGLSAQPAQAAGPGFAPASVAASPAPQVQTVQYYYHHRHYHHRRMRHGHWRYY